MEVKKYLKVNRKKMEMLSALPEDEELMMLNLLKYKVTLTETGLSGAASYRENMKAATPFFTRVQAEIVFFGEPESTLIGPEDEGLWDDVLIVKYKNPSSFFRMVQEERYPSELREQALLDSRLIYCKSHLGKKSK
jgi:hypothetical protein